MFGVGTVVWVKGTIVRVDMADTKLPYLLRWGCDGNNTSWVGGGAVIDPPTAAEPSPDYCLGFAEGYYCANEGGTPFAEGWSNDFRTGWRAGYIHGRAEQDVAILSEVEETCND